MAVPEVKEDFQWCPHAKPGTACGACSIYETRPDRCRDFHCQWLVDSNFGPHWFPKTAKIVVDHKVDGDGGVVYFVVDPACPGRWKEEPYFSDIKTIARTGLAGVRGIKWVTLVLVKEDRILIGR
jgi:hypothetical protein